MVVEPENWPEMMTVPEVAAVLRVSPMTVYRMVHDGDLHGTRVGRKTIRVNREHVAALLKQGMQA